MAETITGFFGNPLNQFDNGVQLDLRTKLAVEFLKARPDSLLHVAAADHAAWALDLAGELLKQAEARGWTKPMPENDELSQSLRRHIRQNVRAQVVQQLAGQSIAQEESPKVQSPANGLGPFAGRG